ncbi:response regulator [Flavobacterium psychrotrophum]|uniref:response regulator n=1 Tax=Flavobacterium psychrotrophum TaxID=2294119 RepID=UPI000E31EAC6|nr:response regulator [Flavobacterium psychrotrophum]
MGQKVILLADDDSDDREMFHEALELVDNNISCYSTLNGSELLEKIHTLEKAPNLIFLDMNMPVMNGWQCLEILKRDERYRDIPVIIISTSSHQKDMETSIQLGAVCYLVKPNDFRDLIEVLKVFTENLCTGIKNAIANLQLSNPKIIFT